MLDGMYLDEHSPSDDDGWRQCGLCGVWYDGDTCCLVSVWSHLHLVPDRPRFYQNM